MPMMPQSEVRVYDPVLTSLSVGYTNGEAIWNQIAPAVPVVNYGGQIIVFDDSTRERQSFSRAPGTGYQVITRQYSAKSYSLDLKGVEFPVPYELVNDAQNIGLEWDQVATQTMMEGLTLELEYEVASMVTNGNNYDASHKVTLSGTDQWNDPTSDIFDHVKAGKSAIRASSGRNPNVMWVGSETWDGICDHPALLDRFKHTETGILTEAMVARAFGVQKLVVGEMVEKINNTNSFIWGKNAGLCYVNPRALASGRTPFGLTGNVNNYTPSFAYTYAFSEHPRQKPVYDNTRKDCYEYQVKFDRQPNLTSISSGYLFTAAVA